MKRFILLALLLPTFALAEVSQSRLDYELEQGQRLHNATILADVMWCEAVSEGRVGMLAVANVVMNRVNDRRFPNTIEEVVHQRHQFECIQNGKRGDFKDRTYRETFSLALEFLDGKTPRITTANHYYADWIPEVPYWSDPSKRLGKIGRHVFYRL